VEKGGARKDCNKKGGKVICGKNAAAQVVSGILELGGERADSIKRGGLDSVSLSTSERGYGETRRE